MEEIIKALIDMEQKAEDALSSVEREKDKLPKRIAAEISHILEIISQEEATAILELKVQAKKFEDARIQAIQEASAKELINFELAFANNRETERTELYERLTRWTV